MAGIAGIIGRIDDANAAALKRMSAAIAHRGPDAEEIFTSAADENGNGCLLARRRIDGIDPVAPATTADGSRIFYDGVVDHPTQVLEQFTAGRDMLKALNPLPGPMSIVAWDGRNKKLLLARDQIGRKPLYFCRNPNAHKPGATWSVLFASQLRGILDSGLLTGLKIDQNAIASIVWNGFVMGPGSIVDGVERMWAGELRVLDTSGTLKHSGTFWTTPPESHDEADDSIIEKTLTQCIAYHIRDGQPVAAFLSGGVDSASVANLATKITGGPIDTFTLALEDPTLDEGGLAQQIAKQINSRHHAILLTEQVFMDGLDAAMDSIEQPTFDAFNQYYICRGIREAGFKMAIGGLGGDTALGGESTMLRLPQLRSAIRATSWVPPALRRMGGHVASKMLSPKTNGFPPQTRWAKLADLAETDGNLIALYQFHYALFKPDFQRELLVDPDLQSRLYYGMPQSMRDWLRNETAGHTPVTSVGIIETRCLNGERVWRDVDASSAAASLEQRAPLADPRLVEALCKLPDSKKFHPIPRKPLLRKYGLAGLDQAIFERPKSGFVLPFENWIRNGRLGKVMDPIMRDEKAASACGLHGSAVRKLWDAFRGGSAGLYWTRPWAIYVYLRWCQQHKISV